MREETSILCEFTLISIEVRVFYYNEVFFIFKKERNEFIINSGETIMKKENSIKKENKKNNTKITTRQLTMIGMLAGLSFILMLLDFPIPLMPPFIKMDFSDLPALIGAFIFGPFAGMFVSLIKNLLHLLVTQTGGVGELSNFILSASFVMTAGFFYRYKKNKKSALLGAILGAFIMTIMSIFSNYYIVYPFYQNFMPINQIIAAYQAILPSVAEGSMDPLLKCLLIFNAPFTFIKAMSSVLITFLIYKPLSPILHGNR